MQRSEVSRAVRPQKGSLGFKGLIYKLALPHSHPKFLFGPLQLSSQKIFLSRRNGGYLPP